MATVILVANGERGKLAKLMECSRPTVRTALNGRVTTSLAYKIRKAALERGGVEVKNKEI